MRHAADAAPTAVATAKPRVDVATIMVLRRERNSVCTLMMPPTGAGCTGLASYWPPLTAPLPGGSVVPGMLYASFVMERFTQNTIPPGMPGTRQAKIFWLVSTWNPYQVAVMQSTLQLGE